MYWCLSKIKGIKKTKSINVTKLPHCSIFPHEMRKFDLPNKIKNEIYSRHPKITAKIDKMIKNCSLGDLIYRIRHYELLGSFDIYRTL